MWLGDDMYGEISGILVESVKSSHTSISAGDILKLPLEKILFNCSNELKKKLLENGFPFFKLLSLLSAESPPEWQNQQPLRFHFTQHLGEKISKRYP